MVFKYVDDISTLTVEVVIHGIHWKLTRNPNGTTYTKGTLGLTRKVSEKEVPEGVKEELEELLEEVRSTVVSTQLERSRDASGGSKW